jgi:basic membrane protein A
MKDLAGSVIQTIGEYYADSTVKGEDKVLGAADDMVGLPTDTWSLQNWSVEDYNALFEKVKSGEITIDDNAEMADPSTAGLEKIKFVK